MQLRVNIIIEIMGRPAEHVKQTLINLIMKIASEKGVKLISKEVHEPLPVKDSKDLFTSFVEASLELDSINKYLEILFNYMPSHIELVTPEEISFSNTDLNNLANQLVQKLHNYDAIAKNSLVERDIMLKKLYEVAPHLFKKPDGSVPPVDRAVQEQANVAKENKKSKSGKGNKANSGKKKKK